MSTLVKRGMRDFKSCFKAHKALTKEDSEESLQQKPKSSSNEDNPNCERGKQVELGTTAEKGRCGSGKHEYIVFYFKDVDPGVDLVKRKGLEGSSRRKQLVAGDHCRKIFEIHEYHKHMDMSETSHSSRSSFSFPRVQSEWTGSPVLMPRPEEHKKMTSVSVQCYKMYQKAGNFPQ